MSLPAPPYSVSLPSPPSSVSSPSLPSKKSLPLFPLRMLFKLFPFNVSFELPPIAFSIFMKVCEPKVIPNVKDRFSFICCFPARLRSRLIVLVLVAEKSSVSLPLLFWLMTVNFSHASKVPAWSIFHRASVIEVLFARIKVFFSIFLREIVPSELLITANFSHDPRFSDEVMLPTPSALQNLS